MITDVPTFGHFNGKVHILPIRIYYEDTDLASVVYHANYLRFMERGRTEFIRTVGTEFIRANGVTKTSCSNELDTTVWTLHR